MTTMNASAGNGIRFWSIDSSMQIWFLVCMNAKEKSNMSSTCRTQNSSVSIKSYLVGFMYFKLRDETWSTKWNATDVFTDTWYIKNGWAWAVWQILIVYTDNLIHRHKLNERIQVSHHWTRRYTKRYYSPSFACFYHFWNSKLKGKYRTKNLQYSVQYTQSFDDDEKTSILMFRTWFSLSLSLFISIFFFLFLCISNRFFFIISCLEYFPITSKNVPWEKELSFC